MTTSEQKLMFHVLRDEKVESPLRRISC